jgi:hypothetical protein
MHQVGNQPRLYYDARSTNHQRFLLTICNYSGWCKQQNNWCKQQNKNSIYEIKNALNKIEINNNHKTQFMKTNNPHMLQYQSAIFRESTNTKDHKTKTPLQPLIALTVTLKH